MKRIAAVVLILAMLCGCAWADAGSDASDAAKMYLELMYLAYGRDPEFVSGYANEIYSYTVLYFAGESIKAAERGKKLGIDNGMVMEGYAMIIQDLSEQYGKYRSGETDLRVYMRKLMGIVKIAVGATD